MIVTLQAQTTALCRGDSITDGNWGNSCGLDKSSEERTHWVMNNIYASRYSYFCSSELQGYYQEKLQSSYTLVMWG